MRDPEQIAELQARADAGDRNAAGRLGELLAEQGDLEGAARAWRFSDVVWQNPAGLHAEFLSALSPEDYLQETLKAARGPVTIDLPGHILTITEAPRREQ
jgi:hypothetical protein